MNILLDENEEAVYQALAAFYAVESTPALVRTVEKNATGYAPALWQEVAKLGWLGLCLPQDVGGQGLPLTYLGLLMEQTGYHIAPLPIHPTLVSALVIAKHGSSEQQALLAQVVSGALILSFAVLEADARWDVGSIRLSGRRDGGDIVLSGTKYFVDDFSCSKKCLVVFRMEETGAAAVILVDSNAPNIHAERLVTTAHDDESVVRFNEMRVPAENLLGGADVASGLMDYAAAFLAAQMQGAARRAAEFAIEYVKQREAFGQPIGAFQAIQHMAADMINSVDGAQLLSREAIWRLAEGLPASVEVSQAKAFANEHCLAVCRKAQQMHGGIGFIADFDINLWYRRVTSWGLRAGTVYDHRQRVAAALLDTPGDVRLGIALELPQPVWTA